MTSTLRIEGLHRTYGRLEALRGIDLLIDQPGVYGFLGPNGAGKTTTIKIVAGLLRPSSGRVSINGVDVATDPVASRRSLGVMMESAAFYEYLSGRDNLRVLARLSRREDDSEITGLLRQVGLAAKAERPVGSYSRGMRQRLGVAAALLGHPQLLILDEPTNGLDPAGIAEMRTWLVDLAKRDGRAVLLCSHQMGEVERICDRVAIIDQGLIIADGPTDSILQPKNSIIVRTGRFADAERALESHPDVEGVGAIDGHTLRAHGPQLTTSTVIRILSDQQIDIQEIVQERESLEDAFFRLVGERRDVA